MDGKAVEGRTLVTNAQLAEIFSSGSSYQQPELIKYGYRFWIRGPVQDCANTLLGAVVLGWPSDPIPGRTVFVCVIGRKTDPDTYTRGGHWAMRGGLDAYELPSMTAMELREIVADSLGRLVDYVGWATGQNHQVSDKDRLVTLEPGEH